MLDKILNFFDKLEDRIRIRLSKYPIIYAFIGGSGIALFWHGISSLSDDLGLSSISALIISSAILLSTGLFVSFFIGDQFIISSLKGDKKIIEKTKEEILAEGDQLDRIIVRINKLEKKIDKLLKKSKE